MADTYIEILEVRFDLHHPSFTNCYIYINNISKDGTPGIEGWHFKAFPAAQSTLDILQAWACGQEDPLLWPLKAPGELS